MAFDRNSKNFSFPGQFGILLGLFGGGIILGSLISAAVWVMMTGRPILSMASDMLNPAYYGPIMLMQVISTLFMFFLPVYFFAKICYREPSLYLGFRTRFNFQQVFWVIVILVLTFPLSGALAEATKFIPLPQSWETKFKAMEAARASQEMALIKIDSFYKYLISLFAIAILPGIFEEVFFRGGLQNLMTRWSKMPWLAIGLTALVFSVVHLSYYGFFVRFALGIILGLMFYYSGSLWLAILMHFLYNGVQVTLLYVFNGKGDILSTSEAEQPFPMWAGALALVLIIYAFKRFRDQSRLQQQKFDLEDEEDPDDFERWIARQTQN